MGSHGGRPPAARRADSSRGSAAPRRIRLEARAKLNLGLAVGPRRDDGFHELATIFQSVTLSDTLVIERRPRGFSLEVAVEDASLGVPGSVRTLGSVGAAAERRRRQPPAAARVPRGSANLVLRAAHRLAAAAGLARGAHFRLTKRIPAGAGLGGGSADAAAALWGLRRLYRVKISREQLLRLALELGSDVPFALHGGTALGRGRGERLTPLRLARPFRIQSMLREGPATLVASTTRSRMPRRLANQLPMMRSVAP